MTDELQREIHRLEQTLTSPRIVEELSRVRGGLACGDRGPGLPLANLRVASPCKVRWDDMVGDDRVRACAGCDRPVFNLSELTREQAEAVLATRGITPCVRFYRRSDGTVMTSDCPTGIPRTGRRLAVVATTALAGSTPATADPATPEPDAVSDAAPTTITTAAPIVYTETMGIPVETTFLDSLPVPAPVEKTSELEWSVWARLGYGIASHPATVIARGTTSPEASTSSAWEFAVNSDLSVPVGPVRLGGWLELRNTSAPVVGGELRLGTMVLRAGGNTDVGTAALGVGYTHDRVGIRIVTSVNRALDDANDWSATLGVELGLTH